jgi:hypothetical protein
LTLSRNEGTYIKLYINSISQMVQNCFTHIFNQRKMLISTFKKIQYSEVIFKFRVMLNSVPDTLVKHIQKEIKR